MLPIAWFFIRDEAEGIQVTVCSTSHCVVICIPAGVVMVVITKWLTPAHGNAF